MKVHTEDLRFWPILNYIPATLLKKVRLVYVFGHAGSDVILATNDDELVLFGYNKYCCLSYDSGETVYDTNPFEEMDELSNKRVKGFASNLYSEESAFVLAYLESGDVYIWGRNPVENDFDYPTLVDALPRTVTEVACGIGHILALTSNGEVFGWGNNSYKQVTYLNQELISKPVQVKEALSSKRVIKISCGFYFSVVVTEHGVVYSWGQNNKGQLGLNMVSNFEGLPHEIVFLRDTRIKDIACGSNHVLATDTRGALFMWGSNDYRQLACNEVQQRSFPSKLQEDFCFTEIAASVNLSVGLSTLNAVYVWGDTLGEPNSSVLLTPCQTINEAFALYNCGCMYKAIEIEPESETVSETIGKSFGNQEGCDFKLIVEGKEIHVHKTILSLRSQYFKRMFDEHWLEAKKSSAQIDENYEAMVAFLKYLYTDKLEADTKLALAVAVIADKYCESNLIKFCLRKFKDGIHFDTVAELYELACEQKMTDFSELCIDFASYHLTAVICCGAFRIWKVDTYRSFFGHDKIKKACRQ